jgi:hypothetical protein
LVYLPGSIAVQKWMDNGGNKDDLMIGKIKITDIEAVRLLLTKPF